MKASENTIKIINQLENREFSDNTTIEELKSLLLAEHGLIVLIGVEVNTRPINKSTLPNDLCWEFFILDVNTLINIDGSKSPELVSYETGQFDSELEAIEAGLMEAFEG